MAVCLKKKKLSFCCKSSVTIMGAFFGELLLINYRAVERDGEELDEEEKRLNTV